MGAHNHFVALSRPARFNPIKRVRDQIRRIAGSLHQPAHLNSWITTPAVLVAGLTAIQNSLFSSLAVAVTIASTHCVYPRRDEGFLCRLWPGDAHRCVPHCLVLLRIPTSSLWPHHWCTSQFTLATCAGAHYLQGCRPDVPCSDRRRTTVSVAIRPCRWRPFSPQTLRSSTFDDLIGSRTFPVAGARIWNTLPLHVTSDSLLTAFKLHLKLHLFCFSFAGLSPVRLLSGPCSVCCHLGHYKNFWLIDWPRGAT